MLGQRILGLIVAISVVSLTASTFAQDEGGRSRRRGGFSGFGGSSRAMTKTTLVGSEQIQTEIKITEEQKKKLDELLASYRESSREFSSRGRSRDRDSDLSDEEREKARAERDKKRAELTKKTEAELAKILDKAQSQRLGEIHLQQQGIAALNTAPVAAALKLSKEQIAKIKETFESRDTKRRKIFDDFREGARNGGGFDREAFGKIREEMEKVQEDADKSVLASLSKEQQESFTKMKGKAFELDRRSLFRRGSRGGSRGGDGGSDRGSRRRRPDVEEI